MNTELASAHDHLAQAMVYHLKGKPELAQAQELLAMKMSDATPLLFAEYQAELADRLARLGDFYAADKVLAQARWDLMREGPKGHRMILKALQSICTWRQALLS